MEIEQLNNKKVFDIWFDLESLHAVIFIQIGSFVLPLKLETTKYFLIVMHDNDFRS